MRKRSIGINGRVTVTEKKKVTMLSRKCGVSLAEYLRQRALGYEPGGHPPTEVFDVLDKLDEIAESCSMRDGAAISAHTCLLYTSALPLHGTAAVMQTCVQQGGQTFF